MSMGRAPLVCMHFAQLLHLTLQEDQWSDNSATDMRRRTFREEWFYPTDLVSELCSLSVPASVHPSVSPYPCILASHCHKQPHLFPWQQQAGYIRCTVSGEWGRREGGREGWRWGGRREGGRVICASISINREQERGEKQGLPPQQKEKEEGAGLPSPGMIINRVQSALKSHDQAVGGWAGAAKREGLCQLGDDVMIYFEEVMSGLCSEAGGVYSSSVAGCSWYSPLSQWYWMSFLLATSFSPSVFRSLKQINGIVWTWA